MDAIEALSNAISTRSTWSLVTPEIERDEVRVIIAELGEQGYAIVPVGGPPAWRDATSGTHLITPHEREVNEVIEAGRTLLRHGADSGNVRCAVVDTFDRIGLAPADFEAVVKAVYGL
jgi:hypothetical protein